MAGAANSNGSRIVLLGPPGSGKGTQAERLARTLGVPAISTGEMLRAAVDAGSELGSRVKSVMAAGELVGDDLMGEIVRERLAQEDARGGFLLDGYPRTASQADTLADILGEKALDCVLFIDAPEKVLVERALGRQRADDREEVIRERLRVYSESTEPLVEAYRGLGLLREIEGDQTIDEVAAEVLAAVRS